MIYTPQLDQFHATAPRQGSDDPEFGSSMCLKHIVTRPSVGLGSYVYCRRGLLPGPARHDQTGPNFRIGWRSTPTCRALKPRKDYQCRPRRMYVHVTANGVDVLSMTATDVLAAIDECSPKAHAEWPPHSR